MTTPKIVEQMLPSAFHWPFSDMAGEKNIHDYDITKCGSKTSASLASKIDPLASKKNLKMNECPPSKRQKKHMLKRNFHLPTINCQAGDVGFHGDYTWRSCVGKESFLFDKRSRLVRGSVSVTSMLWMIKDLTMDVFNRPVKSFSTLRPRRTSLNLWRYIVFNTLPKRGAVGTVLEKPWQKHLEDTKKLWNTMSMLQTVWFPFEVQIHQ